MAMKFVVLASVAAASANIGTLVHDGRWKDALALVQNAHSSNTPITSIASEVRSSVQLVKTEADQLLRLLDPKSGETQVVSPAFQWAQSADQIFLNIKFAHRWSAPGALSVRDTEVTAEGASFLFSGFGDHSRTTKQYKLVLPLFSDVEKEVTWKTGSVGTMQVTMTKTVARRWPRLLATIKDKANAMSYWDAMQDRFSSELKSFDEAERQVCKKNRMFEDTDVYTGCDEFKTEGRWMAAYYDSSKFEKKALKKQMKVLIQAADELKKMSDIRVVALDCAKGSSCGAIEGYRAEQAEIQVVFGSWFRGDWDAAELVKFALESDGVPRNR